MPPKTNKVSLSDISQKIHRRDDFYDAMLRNRFYLPPLSSFVTTRLMEAVRNGDAWMPRHQEIRLLPAPTPPPKYIVCEELQKAIDHFGLRLEVNGNIKPDRDWALHVLSTLQPEHPFFAKDYVYSRKAKPLVDK